MSSGWVPRDTRATNMDVENVMVVQTEILTPIILTNDVQPLPTSSTNPAPTNIIVETITANRLNCGTINNTFDIVTRNLTTSSLFANTLTVTNLTVSGSIPSLTLSNSANQLALNTITLSAPSSVARTYTLPDVGANANFVLTEGNQTINGMKTFTDTPIFPGLAFMDLTLTNTTNQITLGMTNTTTLTSPAPSASRTYTIPDAGGNTSFVMGAGNQTINGTKTFGSGILLPTSGGTPSSFNYYEEYNSTLTFSSGLSAPQIVNVYITRVGRMVNMVLEGFELASTGLTFLFPSPGIPPRFSPSQIIYMSFRVINTSTTAIGSISVHPGGGLIIYAYNDDTGNVFSLFSDTDDLGFRACSVTWAITP